MKPIVELTRDEIRDLKPCVHGGELCDKKKNIRKILDYSINVNHLGPSPNSLKAIQDNLWQISLYPDSNSNLFKIAVVKYLGNINEDNLVVGNGAMEIIHLFCDWS